FFLKPPGKKNPGGGKPGGGAPPPPATDESGEETAEEETTVADSKADAFLSLRANRSRVYVGEGFTVRLSFYIADDSRQELQGYQLNEQIAQILPKIRPDNCWEENFGISGELQTRPAVLNGRRYTEYRVFEAAYFPLNAQEIRFPEVTLNLLTHPAGSAAAATLKPFRSNVFMVQPRPLPPHPLRDRVAVGVFRLQESLTPPRGQTGRSLSYTLRLTGEGNGAGVELPTPTNDANFDFYPPDVQQTVSRQAGRVRGEKVFSYQIIPKRAGNFAMSRYVQFIFFNPQTARFDTLRPQTVVRVTGSNLTASEKMAGPENALYAQLDQLGSNVLESDYPLLIKQSANLVLAVMLAGMVVIFWRIKQ
ncbi:MAG: BatD family protein, partial [Cytophagaceae bacterium]|nr:BatD family protein [Cytophagaceae bacterium]